MIIPVYLSQLIEKLKGLQPTETAKESGILSSDEARNAANIPEPVAKESGMKYPEPPVRTTLPDTTKFEATPFRSSIALGIAGKVAQKNANLEAANQDLAEKSWFEKMKDASDIYKSDRAIDRQSAADEAKAKRLEEAIKAREALAEQKAGYASDLQGAKSDAQLNLEDKRQSGRLSLLQERLKNSQSELKSYDIEKKKAIDAYVQNKFEEDPSLLEKTQKDPELLLSLYDDAKASVGIRSGKYTPSGKKEISENRKAEVMAMDAIRTPVSKYMKNTMTKELEPKDIKSMKKSGERIFKNEQDLVEDIYSKTRSSNDPNYIPPTYKEIETAVLDILGVK